MAVEYPPRCSSGRPHWTGARGTPPSVNARPESSESTRRNFPSLRNFLVRGSPAKSLSPVQRRFLLCFCPCQPSPLPLALPRFSGPPASCPWLACPVARCPSLPFCCIPHSFQRAEGQTDTDRHRQREEAVNYVGTRGTRLYASLTSRPISFRLHQFPPAPPTQTRAAPRYPTPFAHY